MKKAAMFITAVILTVVMAIPVSAAMRLGGGHCGNGLGGYGLMWDDDGSFVDREGFEANLEKAIEEDLIDANDKDAYLEMYDWCSTYGMRGAGGGCGMRRGGYGR